MWILYAATATRITSRVRWCAIARVLGRRIFDKISHNQLTLTGYWRDRPTLGIKTPAPKPARGSKRPCVLQPRHIFNVVYTQSWKLQTMTSKLGSSPGPTDLHAQQASTLKDALAEYFGGGAVSSFAIFGEIIGARSAVIALSLDGV